MTSGLWAFCEACGSLFIGVDGNQFGHFCTAERDIDAEIESIVRAGMDGDQEAMRKQCRQLLSREHRVFCETKLFRSLHGTTATFDEEGGPL